MMTVLVLAEHSSDVFSMGVTTLTVARKVVSHPAEEK